MKKISTIIVNAAWPAVNDAISGTIRRTEATTGNSIHITRVDAEQLDQHRAEHEADRRADDRAHDLVPVVSALLRSTDNAPSTTQNPCWTGNTMRDGDGQRQAEAGAQRCCGR